MPWTPNTASTFRLLAKTSGEYGFDAVSWAGGRIVERGREIDEAGLTHRQGRGPDGVPAPDLHAYDRFMSPEPRAKAA